MIFVWPWNAVLKSKGARDYASYHYAVQTVWEGGNPYQTENLHRKAREEHTRRTVHPFFYPPPSLISMLWFSPFSLLMGYRIFFWFNQLLLFTSFWQINKWLKTPVWFLAFLALVFTPLADSMKMGQLNIWILCLLSIGLARNAGVIIGYAAMSKMSPALIFFQWIAQRNWRPALYCAISVPVFSVLALPLVGLEAQKQFYFEILPQFSSGEYHGLRIPINLPANHSIPDLFNQVWPAESSHSLSKTAKGFASITNILLLGTLLWLSARWRNEESKQYLQGAMICLFLIIPVYCYEHHLSLMVIPIVLVFRFVSKENRSVKICFGVSLFFISWPLFMLRTVQKWLPSLDWLLQESKFFAIISFAVLCIIGAYTSQRKEREAARSSCSDGVK